MKLFVLAAAALLVPQEKNEAEVLFKKMEAKLVAAKTIQMKVKGLLNEGKVEVTVDLHVAEENRARLAAEMKILDQTLTSGSVSDGKNIQVTSPDGTRLPLQPTPEKFGQLVRKCIAAYGGVTAGDAFSEGSATDPAFAYKVTEFVLGPKEKIGETDAQMVQYKLATKDESGITVMVWIDPKTSLPLKRRLSVESRTLEETYSNIKLDEKIDAAKFELPKDK